jgi:L-cysteine desulfidase
MLENNLRKQIIQLIHKEVVPAIGCTEPMAVALCVAKASEILGQKPEAIEAKLSANILKNAMGVGIPGTGMIGLPIAVALGALIGKSEYELEVLKDINPQSLNEGKEYIKEDHIKISLKEGDVPKLYIEIMCQADGHTGKAIISGSHTNFVYEAKDDNIILDRRNEVKEGNDESGVALNMKMVYDFASTTPLDELRFILNTKEFNMNVAHEALKGNYGHSLGKTLERPIARGIMGDSMFSHILAATASGCDARMGGAMIPVMSNSGSGNQGICATNPVAVYAAENHNTEEETIRALTLSHLTAIYIKQSLGTLSALCGCVVASIGSSCGITYLMGGDYDHVCFAVKNMIANLTGMICDGAKPSCALKLTSAVTTAILSSILAMENKCVTSLEGIVDDSVDRSIHNLTIIGADAMNETDHKVLEIMANKN